MPVTVANVSVDSNLNGEGQTVCSLQRTRDLGGFPHCMSASVRQEARKTGQAIKEGTRL